MSNYSFSCSWIKKLFVNCKISLFIMILAYSVSLVPKSTAFYRHSVDCFCILWPHRHQGRPRPRESCWMTLWLTVTRSFLFHSKAYFQCPGQAMTWTFLSWGNDDPPFTVCSQRVTYVWSRVVTQVQSYWQHKIERHKKCCMLKACVNIPRPNPEILRIAIHPWLSRF